METLALRMIGDARSYYLFLANGDSLIFNSIMSNSVRNPPVTDLLVDDNSTQAYEIGMVTGTLLLNVTWSNIKKFTLYLKNSSIETIRVAFQQNSGTIFVRGKSFSISANSILKIEFNITDYRTQVKELKGVYGEHSNLSAGPSAETIEAMVRLIKGMSVGMSVGMSLLAVVGGIFIDIASVMRFKQITYIKQNTYNVNVPTVENKIQNTLPGYGQLLGYDLSLLNQEITFSIESSSTGKFNLVKYTLPSLVNQIQITIVCGEKVISLDIATGQEYEITVLDGEIKSKLVASNRIAPQAS